MSELRVVPIDAILPNPEQPRKEFDPVALQALADSIAAHGIRQFPTVLEEAERADIASKARRTPVAAAVARVAALCPVARTDAEEFELYQLTVACAAAARHRRSYLLWKGVLLSEETDELLLLSQQLGLPRPEIVRVEL